jgi:1,4-alpha-glucan branching enzyme
MPGYLALVLHAHLPFVRHPEHERFLEENWLFEAITETYLPLLRLLEGWQLDSLPARLTLTLTPSLCAMLLDPLLQDRYERHLQELMELAEKEVHRTLWEKPFQELARFYRERLGALHETYLACGRNLVGAFRRFQELGYLEIITSAATHAVLPLLAAHPPSLRAQVLVARDHYRRCFGCEPRGFWLPECAYCEGLEQVLQEANIRWFIVDSHGLLHARPQPRYALFAPVLTKNGLAVFGRDQVSARQVWSRDEGYPGDPRYRDFYRDIGFDLDLDYLKPYLPAPEQRSFTGLKYYRVTGGTGAKAVYERKPALEAAAGHAQHFLAARSAQLQPLATVLDRPPLVLAPYDAELFGHWWYEGPEFLDNLVRQVCRAPSTFTLLTPSEYLRRHPINQVAQPSPSSWGEEGYWRMWLDEKNEWIYPHLRVAQERMTELVHRFQNGAGDGPGGHGQAPASALVERALAQAGRELLLAQASDWPFILRTGTAADYARRRVQDHLARFTRLWEQLARGQIDEPWLRDWECRDNLFPQLDWRYWA